MKFPVFKSKFSFFLILVVIFFSKCSCNEEEDYRPAIADYPDAYNAQVNQVLENESGIYKMEYDENGKMTSLKDETDAEAKLEHDGNRVISMVMPSGQTYAQTFGPNNERIGISATYGTIKNETTFELTNEPAVLKDWVADTDEYEYYLATRVERTTEITQNNGSVENETNSVVEDFSYLPGLTGTCTMISYVGNQPYQNFNCTFTCSDKVNNLIGNDAICMLSQDILIDAFSSISYAVMPYSLIELVLVNPDTQDKITFTWTYEYDETGRIISKDLASTQQGFPPFNFDFVYNE